MTWLQHVLEQPDDQIPQVLSTSYGDDEQTVPFSYARRVCEQFAQLGARGVSVLFSSGDNGVGARRTCYSNDGRNTSIFLPAFPTGCPYVRASWPLPPGPSSPTPSNPARRIERAEERR